MLEPVRIFIPKFVDHIGVKDVYDFFENKISLYDMSYMDSINIANWKANVSKGEQQFISTIKMFRLADAKITSKARITIHIVQNFRKFKDWIEIGSTKKEDVPQIESAQELQVYAMVQKNYPEHFNIDMITKKNDDFSYREESHFYHILKQTKFNSKSEIIVWNLGHCMYWYLKELNIIGSKKTETSANRFAFLWLYEFNGEEVNWQQTEFAK